MNNPPAAPPRPRAQAEGLELETREADAQDLPFPDATFDVVLSTFGVIFAPDQAGAAAELPSCLDRFNRATDGTLVAPADYLQVVATRAAG